MNKEAKKEEFNSIKKRFVQFKINILILSSRERITNKSLSKFIYKKFYFFIN